MDYKSICSIFMGFFIVYFISLTVEVDDIFAFHDKKTVEFNNEINQIAIEVGNYINQTQTILQSNNVNLSKAAANLNFAQLRLAELQNWHSNSTIADMMNEMSQESTVFQGTSGSSGGGSFGGGSVSTFTSPSTSAPAIGETFTSPSTSAPSISSSAPASVGGFEGERTTSGTATGSFDSGTGLGSTEGSIGSGTLSSSSATGSGTAGSSVTSSGSFADLSNPGEFSQFQDPIPRQPGQPLHPTLPTTPNLPPEPAEPLAPVIPPPSSP